MFWWGVFSFSPAESMVHVNGVVCLFTEYVVLFQLIDRAVSKAFRMRRFQDR